MVRHQIRRFGGLAVRLLAAALLVLASMGLAVAASGRGVEAQEDTLTVVPGENALLVSDLAVAQAADVIGQPAYVAAETLSYRAGPALDAAVIDLLPFGTTGVVTDGPVAADGYMWYEFDIAGYGDAPGWVAGEFLATNEGSSAGTAPAAGGFVTGSEVVVNGDDLNLRDQPGLDGGIIAPLSLGMRLTVLDGPSVVDGFGWYLVQSADLGVQGWVAGEFLTESPGASATFQIGEAVVINADGLNLRDTPTLAGEVVTQLSAGTVATVTGGPLSADGYWWYEIALDGTNPAGWVAADFLAHP